MMTKIDLEFVYTFFLEIVLPWKVSQSPVDRSDLHNSVTLLQMSNAKSLLEVHIYRRPDTFAITKISFDILSPVRRKYYLRMSVGAVGWTLAIFGTHNLSAGLKTLKRGKRLNPGSVFLNTDKLSLEQVILDILPMYAK